MEDLSGYNPEGSDLRNMQLRMVEMLEYLDSVCLRHNIKYWMGAGTLLGAVRHQGFIPWDDDLDIEMTRADYKKLIRILRKENSGRFVLQTPRTDWNYVFPLAKLRDTGSRITELRNSGKNYRYKGIYIDIFYLDRGNTFLARLTVNLQKFIWVLSLVKNDPLGIIPAIRFAFRFVLHEIIFPFLRLCARLFGIRTLILPYGTGFTAFRDLKEIFPLQRILFEGKYFNAPADTDAYLKRLYCDYMKLPDRDKREIHTIQKEML